MSIRIGGVPYGVGAPLLAGLEAEPGVAFVQAPPTTLIAQLRAGALDAALVSSIEAVRQPGYRVVPDLGIAAAREVRSVRAFRRRGAPIRTVALDTSSATSVALLRLLLLGPHRADTAPEVAFAAVPPGRTPDARPEDLVLLIGDHGLHADAGARQAWDLAAEWRAWTALPFVFANWLLAPTADAARVLPVLARARSRGRARGSVDGTAGAVHYELGDDDRRGLQRFWQLAHEAGLAALPTAAFAAPASSVA